jgi:ubiquinol-cytochrome c reductase core subunit 2
LVNHVFNPAFQPYEFLDAIPNVLAESSASLADPSVEVFDKLHQIAFRAGLGNSLFATTAGVKGLKRAHLQEFASKTFTSDKIAVVGSGVVHEELTALVDEALKGIALASSKYTPSASKYFGGEARIEAGPKSNSTFAVAFKSVPFTSPEYPAALVLKALLDGTQHLKWGSVSGASSLLSKAASGNNSVSAFATSYSDAGILGFVVEGEASGVQSVAQKSIDAIKSVASGSGVSAESLARAKKAAIIDAEAASFASRDDVIQEVGKQVLASGNYSTLGELATAISKVTLEDVKKVRVWKWAIHFFPKALCSLSFLMCVCG